MINKQEKLTKVKLKGNESFNIREGWLRKGMRCVREDKTLFSKDDAIALGGCISKILGKPYGLGVSYGDTDTPQQSPVDVLLQRAKDSGMTVSAPDANQL